MNAAANRSTRRAYIAQLKMRKVLWLVLFCAMVLFPVIVTVISNSVNGTWRADWQRDVASFLGMTGLSLMIMSFIPITRDKFITATFNLDILYKFHHTLGLLGFWLAVSHLVLLWINNPAIANLLNLFVNNPLYVKAGTLGLLAAAVLVFISYFRKEIKLNYDIWKIAHSVLTVVMVVFGMIHILGFNYYTASPLVRGYYYILLALAIISLVWLRFGSAFAALGKPYRITDVIAQKNLITEIKLEYAGSEKKSPLAYHAGQIAWITIRRSAFSFRKHPFSIASSDVDQNKIGFAIRELGDLTSRIKDLKLGETVYVEGGFGTFSVDKLGDKGFVMVAGGIGIAPTMSILRTLADRQDKRKFILFYGSRDRDSIGFYEELEDLSKKIDLEVVHVLEKTDDPAFEKGYITQAVLERHFPKDKENYDVFICGPGPMLNIVLKSLKGMDIPEENIWEEYYEMA